MAVLKDLIVHGPSRFLNAAYYNKIKANSLAAEDGYFNKLVAISGKISDLDVEDLTAQNATVIGLLDVKGELHTNSWTNSNIATIDGSFYITPTVSCESGTFAYDGTNITVTAASGYSFGVNSLYTYTTDGVATTYTTWPESSRVLLTGEVRLNGSNEWQPLGTIRGQIVNSSTSSIKINSLNDSQGTTPIATLVSLGSTSISNASFRKVKVSLYERASGSTFFPIGIYMTALGEKGKTFIDIYGGGDAKASVTTNNINSGAMAKPVLRIGNLSGLPTLGTVTPGGWGIYTTNGFFSGTMVAKRGIIGEGTKAWTIGKTSNTGAESFLYAPTTGPQSPSANTVGIYIGTDGINNYASGTQYVRIYGGKIYAQGADIQGVLKADTGRIGGSSGWTIASQQISSGTLGSDNSMFLSTKNLSGTVSGKTFGSSNPAWRLTVGSNFGITNTGSLYASEAVISGAITANSLNVGSASDPNHLIYDSSTGAIDLSTNWLKFDDSTDSVIIGDTTKSYAAITPKSFKLNYDNNYVVFEDLRENDGTCRVNETIDIISTRSVDTSCNINSVEHVYIEESFIGDGSTKTFTISNNVDTLVIVRINGEQTTDFTRNNKTVTLNVAPALGDQVRITYYNSDYTVYTKKIMLVSNCTGQIQIIYFTSEPVRNYNFGTNDGINRYSFLGTGGFVFGKDNDAEGRYSYARGFLNDASGFSSSAIGDYSKASGYCAFAAGESSNANARASFALGYMAKSYGFGSHAEGRETLASGSASHSEGYNTQATSANSHAEGNSTIAKANNAHAEGGSTIASNACSHSEGSGTTASGSYSHAQNEGTLAQGYAQTTIGRYNVAQGTANVFHTTDDAFIIGNGTADNARSNALTVDYSGNVNIASGAKYKINGIALSASDVGAVPTSRTINNKALSGDITLSASDVGAVTFDDIYPIGSIYMSVSSVSPATLFGGTWTQIKGRFLLAAGTSENTTYTVGQTGGSKDAVVVSHSHEPTDSGYRFMHAHANLSGGDMSGPSGSGRHYPYLGNRSDGAYWGSGTTTASTGVSGTDKNMPPYTVVYMWKRTA